ncbi:hypothetical protein FKP32DRAFT_1459994 [Trametes sanguinea]|nr:hypothetical protein FKP32DRAFT_1459994 [Trametes sanguinea]
MATAARSTNASVWKPFEAAWRCSKHKAARELRSTPRHDLSQSIQDSAIRDRHSVQVQETAKITGALSTAVGRAAQSLPWKPPAAWTPHIARSLGRHHSRLRTPLLVRQVSYTGEGSFAQKLGPVSGHLIVVHSQAALGRHIAAAKCGHGRIGRLTAQLGWLRLRGCMAKLSLLLTDHSKRPTRPSDMQVLCHRAASRAKKAFKPRGSVGHNTEWHSLGHIGGWPGAL